MNLGSVLVVILLEIFWLNSSLSQRPGRRSNQWRNPHYRRMPNRRPAFSPQIMGLMKRGWGRGNIYNKVNKAFGRCDIPNEDVVKTMFPGLFRSVDDIYSLPEMRQNRSRTNSEKVAPVEEQPAIRKWHAVPSRKIPIPKVISTSSRNEVVLTSDSSAPARTASFSRDAPIRNAFICDCCKVDRFFETYENVTVGTKTYEVIQIPNEGQFFAIERCPEKNFCSYGGCIQRYTRQPILIWNDTKPYYPPLDFAQFDFPTHCEWANVGQ